MEYVMFIYNAEDRWAALSEAEEAKIMAGHMAILEQAEKDGTYRGGNRLMDVADATTVRNHAGKITVTDGPFAETKEQLGGYYVFECDNIDQVIAYASLLPHDDIGCVEIRPVFPEPLEG
ncbi:MAG: YciI family protein [Pseudomonadota bacterium]